MAGGHLHRKAAVQPLSLPQRMKREAAAKHPLIVWGPWQTNPVLNVAITEIIYAPIGLGIAAIAKEIAVAIAAYAGKTLSTRGPITTRACGNCCRCHRPKPLGPVRGVVADRIRRGVRMPLVSIKMQGRSFFDSSIVWIYGVIEWPWLGG